MPIVRGGCVLGVLAIALILDGCGGKKLPAVDPGERSATADLSRAAALVAAGCYDCLKDALDIYQRVGASGTELIAEVANDGALTTALVLAIRERQLGFVDSGYVERARNLADLTSNPNVASTLTDIADSIPWPPSTRARDEAFSSDRARAVRRNLSAWRETLRVMTWPMSVAVRYIAVTFDCTWPERDVVSDGSASAGDVTEPLLLFADSICRGTSADPFITLLQREPRFIEAGYYIGLRALGARKLDEADDTLTNALAWHADWPSLTMTLAGVAMTAEDPARALTLYDRTLAMVPGQQDARLGRVTALSYLGRFEEAVSTADGLIQEGQWFVGDALYWRAWNKTQLGRIDEAWSDVQRAMSLLVDDKTPKLAGIISVKRQRYEEAKNFFELARTRNPADCDTAFYLAAVHAQRHHWPPSATIFSEAAGCFDGVVTALRAEIARLEASDEAPDRKQRVIAKRTEQMTGAIKQAGTSYYNAAVGYLNAGTKDEARRHAVRAAEFDEYKDRMGELLARIEKLR